MRRALRLRNTLLSTALKVPLPISQVEMDKLLDLVGHDGACSELVVRMYLCLMAYSNDKEELPLEVSKEDILSIHKVFTPTAFGQGGREFRLKLGSCIVEIERMEYLDG